MGQIFCVVDQKNHQQQVLPYILSGSLVCHLSPSAGRQGVEILAAYMQVGSTIILCLDSLTRTTYTQTRKVKAEANLKRAHASAGVADMSTESPGPQNAAVVAAAATYAASRTYLVRSAPGGKLKLVGVGEGVAEMSRDCSGIGD